MIITPADAELTTRSAEPDRLRLSRVVPYLPIAGLVPLWWALVRTPFWRDEVASVVAAGKTPSALWAMVDHTTDAPMGLYYFLLGPLVRATSDPAVIRLPSLLATAAAVAITITTARRLAGPWSAFVVGLLMVGNGILLYLAGIARAYPLALVATTLATHVLLTARTARSRTTVTYGLCAVLAIYLHAMTALVFIAQGLALLLFPRFRALRWRFGTALVVAAGASLPLAVRMVEQAGATSWIPLVRSGRQVFDVAEMVAGGAALGMVIAVGLVLTLLLARRIGPGVIGALVLMIIVPFAGLAALGAIEHVFSERYLAFLVPPLALLTTAGWTYVPRIAVVPVIACVTAVGVDGVASRMVQPPVDDPQAAAAFIATHDAPGDVIVYSPTPTRTEIRYFLQRRRDVQAVDVAVVPGVADATSPYLYLPELPAAEVRAQLLAARRIWWVGLPGSAYRPTENTAADVYASLPQRPVIESRWFGDLNVSLVQEGQ